MNIYVGNLSQDTSVDEVRSAFRTHGQVKWVKMIRDPESGTFRGFAFVGMASPEESAKAIGALNGTELGGQQICVNSATTSRDRRNADRRRPARSTSPWHGPERRKNDRRKIERRRHPVRVGLTRGDQDDYS